LEEEENSWQKAADATNKTLLFHLQVPKIEQLLMQDIKDRQKANVMQL
jgi:hypothetical protein